MLNFMFQMIFYKPCCCVYLAERWNNTQYIRTCVLRGAHRLHYHAFLKALPYDETEHHSQVFSPVGLHAVII